MFLCLILSSLEVNVSTGWLVVAGTGFLLLAREDLEGWTGLLLLPRGWLAREDLEGLTISSFLPSGWLALGWMFVGIIKPLAD